jgi:hypothetical protein
MTSVSAPPGQRARVRRALARDRGDGAGFEAPSAHVPSQTRRAVRREDAQELGVKAPVQAIAVHRWSVGPGFAIMMIIIAREEPRPARTRLHPSAAVRLLPGAAG